MGLVEHRHVENLTEVLSSLISGWSLLARTACFVLDLAL